MSLDSGEAVLDVEVEGRAGADPAHTLQWLTSYYPVALDDEVIGIGVVVADITERKKAEEAHRQLAAIVAGSGDAIFGVTSDGTVTSWNAAAQRLLGAQGFYLARPMAADAMTRLVAESHRWQVD